MLHTPSPFETSPGLYLVASPIGNLSDLSYRAVMVLTQVDYVFCEDTRVSSKLLNHINSTAIRRSCHAHNEKRIALEISELIKSGHKVAYLSDAGTPGLSDPGNLLVQAVSQEDLPISPIPGCSSLACLISVCGFNLAKGFFFAGFLPRKKGAMSKITEAHPLIFAFESPYRMIKSLELIVSINPLAQICLGRELTKKHEEILRGTAEEILAKGFVQKGEFVLAINQNPSKKLI